MQVEPRKFAGDQAGDDSAQRLSDWSLPYAKVHNAQFSPAFAMPYFSNVFSSPLTNGVEDFEAGINTNRGTVELMVFAEHAGVGSVVAKQQFAL